jgi:hypothetical protein
MRAKVHAASVFDRDGIKPLWIWWGEVPAPLAPVAGRGYNGKGEGKDWAEKSVRLERKGRETTESVGVGARRPRTTTTARLYGVAQEMGRGADVLVAGAKPEDEQGLRALPESARTFIHVAIIRLMVRRLARS